MAVGNERLAGVYGSKVAVINVWNVAGTGIEHQPTAVGIAKGIVWKNRIKLKRLLLEPDI